MPSMKNQELTMLADHMGHHLHIHANHYRLQTDIMERSKVARILLAVNSGLWKRSGVTNLDDLRAEDIPFAPEGRPNIEQSNLHYGINSQNISAACCRGRWTREG